MINNDIRLELMRVAIGKEESDTVITNGNVISVTTGERLKMDIAIKSGFIALVGNAEHTIGEKTQVIDADGVFLIPGLIESHFHVESTMLTLTEYAKVALPHGTTTICADVHEIGNILGVKGIKLMINESYNTPLRFFVVAPSTPATLGFETLGSELKIEDLEDLFKNEFVVGIDEISNTKRVFIEEPIYLSKIFTALKMEKIVDGSMPRVVGKELNAMACMGIQSDHESRNTETALQRLRLGMGLMIREGSTTKNLSDIVKMFTDGIDTRYCILVADDIHPIDLLEKGHLDRILRRTVESGVNPITAIQMTTINPAEHLGLEKTMGSITPGRVADIIFVDDLFEFQITKVMIHGEIIAEDGKLLVKIKTQDYPSWALNTVYIQRQICPEDFIVKTDRKKEAKVRVITLNKSGSHRCGIETLIVKDWKILPDLKRDIIRMAVVERHGKTEGPTIAKGFVRGLGIQKGAVASSIAHDAHNIIVVGTNNLDMATAVNRIVEIQGGIVATKNSKVLDELKLPLAGIMSVQPIDTVTKKLESLHSLVHKELGCRLPSPFMALSFQTIAPRQWIKLTDKGLFNGTNIVPLEVDDNNM